MYFITFALDAEVAALTSSLKASSLRARPRSASPTLSKPTFTERYGLTSPTYYSELEKIRREARLRRLTDPYWPYLSVSKLDFHISLFLSLILSLSLSFSLFLSVLLLYTAYFFFLSVTVCLLIFLLSFWSRSPHIL